MLKTLKSRRLAVASGVLLLQALIYYGVSRTETVPEIPSWSDFPSETLGWKIVGDSPIDQATLEKLKPDDYLNRDYRSSAGSEAVNLFIAYFKTLRDGRGPHSPEACLPSSGWASVSAKTVPLTVPGLARPLDVNQYIVEKDGNRLLVFYWYQLGNRAFTSQLAAQFYAVPRLLFHGRTDIALVRIITPVSHSELAAANQLASRFGAEFDPLVTARLQ